MPKILTDEEIANFRHRLCQVAEAQFAAHGPQGVSMRQIARELGVSAMTPYHYFADKEDMLAAVRTAAFGRFAALLEAAHAAAQPAGPVACGQAIGQAYVRFAMQERAAYRLMFELSQPNEALYPALTAATARVRRAISLYVVEMAADGDIDGDPQLIAHGFWAALHGMVTLELSGKLPAEVDPAALRQVTFSALSRGIGMERALLARFPVIENRAFA